MAASRENSLMKRIEELRIQAGMSQTDLAKAVGKGPSSASQWESGKTTPTLDTISALAGVFKVDPGWLAFGGTPGKVVSEAPPDIPSDMWAVPEVERVLRGRGRLHTKHLWTVPIFLLSQHFRTKPEDAALVEVRAEGVGGLAEHDYVLIDRSATFPTRASLYVLNVKEGLIVRHATVLGDTPLSVQIRGAEGTKDTLIHDENDLNILGRVVGVIKRPS